MPSLLIRDIDKDTKQKLAVSAAKNGRSQQAEVVAILQSVLNANSESWVSMLHENAASVDGIDFESPKRHTPRITGVQI